MCVGVWRERDRRIAGAKRIVVSAAAFRDTLTMRHFCLCLCAARQSICLDAEPPIVFAVRFVTSCPEGGFDVGSA
jgi:hypothetical protein